MYAVYQLFNTVVDLYIYCLIALVISSWLVAFGVLNMYNPIVNRILVFLEAITDPVLRYIRRVIPTIGGLDLSVVVLLLGIQFLRQFINDIVFM